MQLLILILKQVDLMNDILKELKEAGIKGCTQVDAKGMGEALMNVEDFPMFGALRQMLNNEERENVKLLLFVVQDDEVVPTSKTIKKVVDLEKPNTGILFSLPIYYCEGLTK